MKRSGKLKILRQLSVIAPCPTNDFSAITVRSENGWFCNQCQKQVHDFAQLSALEIAALIEQTGGKLCASIRRKPDGSIITRDVPPKSVISGGSLLAGTAIFASSAFAQQPPIEPKTPTIMQTPENETITVGQIVSSTASPSPVKSPAPTSTPQLNIQEHPVPHFSEEKGGVTFVPTENVLRGRVAVNHRSDGDGKSKRK